MATLHAAADGTILRLLQTQAEEAANPVPPPGTSQTVTFDETTNAALLQGLNTDWNSHQVVGGVLVRNGLPVAINAPSVAYQQRLDAPAVRSLVAQQIQSLVGLAWTNMTAAQKQMLIVALLYKVGALDKTLTVQPLANWL